VPKRCVVEPANDVMVREDDVIVHESIAEEKRR
jgi:hypothetical protein